jgi:hypothetical protein
MAGKRMPAHLKTGWKYERVDLRPYSKFEDLCYDASITSHLGVALVGLSNSHSYIKQWQTKGGVPRQILVDLREILMGEYKKLPAEYPPIPKGGELEPEERLPIEMQEKLEFKTPEQREHYRKKIDRIRVLETEATKRDELIRKLQATRKSDRKLFLEYERAIKAANAEALASRKEIAELKKHPPTQIAEVTALLTLRVNGEVHEYELDPTPQLKEVLAREAGNLNGSLSLAMKHS